MPTNILVVGAGAIGAFYASRLAQAAATRASVICRSNYKAVKANGFTVGSPLYGDYTFMPYQTFSSSDEARKSETLWDYIVVATKALPDVSDDSETLNGLVSDKTAIVLMQNGIGIEDPYAKRFPDSLILSAVCFANVGQVAPGKIKHMGWTKICLGPYLPKDSASSGMTKLATEKASKLVELFEGGGIEDAEEFDHTQMQFVRWHKVAINTAMNPSAVLSCGSQNAAMALDPEMYNHLKDVMYEVLDTAPKILGQPFPEGFTTPEMVLNSTSKNTSGSRPSMLLDWEEGKKMELEVILGNPLRLAREHGLQMPRVQSLYALIKMAQVNREKATEGSQSKL